jgi:hypothetical protein
VKYLMAFVMGGLLVFLIGQARSHGRYRVVGSEPYTKHYDGPLCSEHGEGFSCDFDELRYTLLHNDVKVVANCQAWDPKNPCGSLRVGEFYRCTESGNAGILESLDCGDSSLAVEREQVIPR